VGRVKICARVMQTRGRRKISRKGKGGRIRETIGWRKLRRDRIASPTRSGSRSIEDACVIEGRSIDAARAVQRSASMIHLACASRVSLKRCDETILDEKPRDEEQRSLLFDVV